MNPPAVCAACGTELGPGLLACPACQALVHRARLEALVAQASADADAGQIAEAIRGYEEALGLLPPNARQHRILNERLAALHRTQAPADSNKARSKGGWAGLGAIALALLTKGKALLLGLGKASTFFSMALTFGIYWTAYGWAFALGLVLAIYVHEMGHILEARRLGLPVTAPLFVPGVGAFVRLKLNPANVHDDAALGLAGPVFGIGASVFAYLAFLATDLPVLAAIAQVSGWINLFNLLPIGSLDGGRGFRALSRSERWGVTFVLIAVYVVTQDGLPLLLALVAGGRALFDRQEGPGDGGIFVRFIVVLVIAAALAHLAGPGATAPTSDAHSGQGQSSRGSTWTPSLGSLRAGPVVGVVVDRTRALGRGDARVSQGTRPAGVSQRPSRLLSAAS